METRENGFNFDYDSTIMYPFGYGLSYTRFTQEIVSSDSSGDKVTMDVSVTNTDSTAGKDVVELVLHPALHQRQY